MDPRTLLLVARALCDHAKRCEVLQDLIRRKRADIGLEVGLEVSYRLAEGAVEYFARCRDARALGLALGGDANQLLEHGGCVLKG